MDGGKTQKFKILVNFGHFWSIFSRGGGEGGGGGGGGEGGGEEGGGKVEG